MNLCLAFLHSLEVYAGMPQCMIKIFRGGGGGGVVDGEGVALKGA